MRFEVATCSDFIEQRLQTVSAVGENWQPMRKKDLSRFNFSELRQRLKHSCVIGAVFSGQKCKPVRIEVNESVAQYEERWTDMSHDRNLPGSSACDRDYVQETA